MKSYEEYNKFFLLEHHIGTVLSEEEFQVLLTGGKIYTTDAWFTGEQAQQVIGGDLSRYPEELTLYGGGIVADSFEEARQVAEKRGWGETVDFVLTGIFDETLSEKPNTISVDQHN